MGGNGAHRNGGETAVVYAVVRSGTTPPEQWEQQHFGSGVESLGSATRQQHYYFLVGRQQQR